MKNIAKRCIPALLLAGLHACAYAQNGVGIGTNSPHESAILHIQPDAAPKGLLIPRYTTADRDNIENLAAGVSLTEGLMIYNTEQDAFNYYDGRQWIRLIPSPAKFNVDMNNYKMTNLANGTGAGDAVNKGQLDAVDNANLNRNGSEAMTGNLNMGSHKIVGVANGTNANDVVNKGQLNTVDNNNLNLDGTDTMTGDLNMGGKKVTNLSPGTADTDAITLSQLEAIEGRIVDAEWSTARSPISLVTPEGDVVQQISLTNATSTTRSYFCTAYVSFIGISLLLGGVDCDYRYIEGVHLGLYKEDAIFSDITTLIYPGTNSNVITGTVTLSAGESVSIKNKVRLSGSNEICIVSFYDARGMFCISGN